MRLSRPVQQLLFACSLLALTLLLPLSLQTRCKVYRKAHSDLLDATLLIDHAQSVDVVLNAQRRLATAFLALDGRGCSVDVPKTKRRELEFGGELNVRGLLLYLLSVIGLEAHVAVEIDSMRRPALMCKETIAWNVKVVGLYESWAGFEAARVLCDSQHVAEEIRPVALEVEGGVQRALASVGVGVVVDLLAVLSGVNDGRFLKEVRGGGIKPRVVAVFYQDYWAGRHVMRNSSGDGRLFVGGSLGGVEKVLGVGFRLVWCMEREPVAFFVARSIGEEKLKTISAAKCLKRRDTGIEYRRDMEAQYDAAQRYSWLTL